MGDENKHSEPRQPVQIEQDDLVIFGEDGRFYLVQKVEYSHSAHELPAPLMSAAEFLVGLGSVVSDITAFEWDATKELMGRCACVLLNLASLRQLSEKEKGKPLTFLRDRSDKDRNNKDGNKKTPPSSKLHANGKTHAPIEPLGKSDVVIFNEDRKFYLVREKDYQSNELPKAMSGAPELMVKLGTVAADIPRIPTAGTACFLLNLASLRRGSGYASRLVEESNLAARLHDYGKPRSAQSIVTQRTESDRAFAQDREQALAAVGKWQKRLAPRDRKENTKERKLLQRQARASMHGKRKVRIAGVVGLVGVVGIMKRSLFAVLGVQH